MARNEDLVRVFIPDNYKAGVTVSRFQIKLPNAIQAGLFGFIALFLCSVSLWKLSFVPTELKFSLTFCFVGVIVLLGYIGIDGDTIFAYFKRRMLFNQRKRKAYYNSRVKTESISFVEYSGTHQDLLPKEKVLLMIEKYKQSVNDKEQQKALSFEEDNINLGQELFFEDDIGVKKKPVEYMTKKERKQYYKEQQKEKQLQKRNKKTK